MRAVRKSGRKEKIEEIVIISAADPLNLVGIVTPEARVPAIAGNRVLLRDGVPIAALEGGALRRLARSDFDDDALRTLFWRRSGELGFVPRALSPARRRRALAEQADGVG